MKREEIILALMAGDPVVGITRLQKLLFLVEHEGDLKPSNDDFDFEAYKFGPVSKKLYDDICLLRELGLIEVNRKQTVQEIDPNTDPMQMDATELLSPSALGTTSDYDDDIDESDEEGRESRELDVYRLTNKGHELLRSNGLLESLDYKKIERVKKRHGGRSLIDLLRYVYSNFESFATESEITDKVR
jgi:hypothetical protein